LEDNTNIGCCTEFFLNNYREKFQFDDPYFGGKSMRFVFFEPMFAASNEPMIKKTEQRSILGFGGSLQTNEARRASM
jgi:hypothetical protein